MISARHIVKRFDKLTIFDDLSFDIKDGEYVCFSGPSGAGKTTLLNIIGLLEPIDSGELLINGRNCARSRDKREYYRKEVGFLFQNFGLIENKTVYDNLMIVKPYKGKALPIETVLNRVGLEDKIDSKIYTLSGGEQQRVALARLMLKQCNIILADEPTGSLDRENATIVMNLLESLNHEGKTVIIVTHDENIKKRAGRIMEL